MPDEVWLLPGGGAGRFTSINLTEEGNDKLYIMGRLNNKNLRQNSRNLRSNMTRQERHLWYDFFKKNNIKAKRQKVFDNYIVDFYLPDNKLVIELDGSQHYQDAGMTNDRHRDDYFTQLGIDVIRYSNADIDYRFNSVCDDIADRMGLS